MQIALALIGILLNLDLTSSKTYDVEAMVYDAESLNSSSSPDNYDFILRLSYVISEIKVPPYLVDILYDNPIENNVTSDDISVLFRLPNMTVNTTHDVLNHLGFNISKVFSLEGFDTLLTELDWKFIDFYETIRGVKYWDISASDQISMLNALEIDTTQFFLGIALGEPDPYDEFKKGDFSLENLENATGIINKTTDDLFEVIRDMALEQLVVLNSSDVVNIFKRNSIGRNETVIIWNYINITTEDIYNVEGFRNHLSDISDNLNVTTLGVAIRNDTVTINQRTYDIWKNVSQIIDVQAQSLNNSAIVTLSGVSVKNDSSILTLTSDETLTFIEPGDPKDDIGNCTFVTWTSGVLVRVEIENVTYRNELLEITNVTESVILGSPLVCDNKVYGIAREALSENILLDTYSAFVTPGTTTTDSPNTNTTIPPTTNFTTPPDGTNSTAVTGGTTPNSGVRNIITGALLFATVLLALI